jgi:hypothetical protein
MMRQEASMSKWRRVRFAVATCVLTAAPAIGLITATYGQVSAPVKIALPVFLSGPAVGSFGEPSRNAAEVVIDAIILQTVPRTIDAISTHQSRARRRQGQRQEARQL